MDALSYHAYRPGHKAQVVAAKNLRAALNEAGERKMPMHLTEFGRGTCEGLYSQRVCLTPRHQAHLLGAAYRALERKSRRLNLRSAHWYLHEDLCERTDDRCDHAFFGHFGLAYQGGQQKPAWNVYRRRARR